MPKVKNQRKLKRTSDIQVMPSSIPPYQSLNNKFFVMECYLAKVTSTVTTGVIAFTQSIEAGLVSSFGSRFDAYDEYLIEWFELRVDTCSSNLSGLLNVWIEADATNTGTPTATNAKQNKTLTFAAGANQRTHKLRYNPRNPVTQKWTPTGTTNASIGNVKVYTNTTDFAASTVATDYAVLTGTMGIWLRGFS